MLLAHGMLLIQLQLILSLEVIRLRIYFITILTLFLVHIVQKFAAQLVSSKFYLYQICLQV